MDVKIQGDRDGIETAAILRSSFGVPAVYLTAHADQATLERAKTTEPYGYLVKPVQDADLQRVIDFAVYKRDMEEARQRIAQLELQKRSIEDARRLKEEFLRTMSDELRSPLQSIIGFASLMYDRLGMPNAGSLDRQFLGAVLTNGRRVLQLIHNMLTLAALEGEILEVLPKNVHLPRLVEDVIHPLRLVLEEKQIELRVDIDPGCTQVVGDSSILEQIVNVLVSNTIQFTPTSGSVWLRVTSADDEKYRLAVLGSGIGIPAADWDRLFVAFEQPDSGSTRNFEGAGLGLTMAKRLVEAQGGSIGVERTAGLGNALFAVLPKTLSAWNAVSLRPPAGALNAGDSKPATDNARDVGGAGKDEDFELIDMRYQEQRARMDLQELFAEGWIN